MSETRRLMRLAAIVAGLATAAITVGTFGILANTVMAKSSSNKFGLITPGTLTIANYGGCAPPICTTASNHLTDVDGDFLTDFAKSEHLKVHLYNTTFSSVILAVEQHKADVGTYYYYTAARAKVIYYSYPYYAERAAVITMKSFHYKGISSLAGDKIGVTTGEVWASYLQSALGADALLFPNEADQATALLNGQIQGFVQSTVGSIGVAPLIGKPVVAHLLSKGDWGMPASVLSTLDYNLVACDRTGLARAMDKYEVALHKSGEWTKILKKSHAGAGAAVSSLKAPVQYCG